MITIQPEAKSQLLCVRCRHSEDEHSWQTGPCNHKQELFNCTTYRTHCTCYAFVFPKHITNSERIRFDNDCQ